MPQNVITIAWLLQVSPLDNEQSQCRSHSRDARAQDAVRRDTDAQPDALRSADAAG